MLVSTSAVPEVIGYVAWMSRLRHAIASASAVLSKQKPAWTPGEYHGYHCYSLGWYENELIRRTDSKQRTIGQFFSEEIAGPLDVEFYIGTPPDIPENRIVNIIDYSPLKMLFHLVKYNHG